MKSSTYYFHMKTEILTNFRMYISVPLGCCIFAMKKVRLRISWTMESEKLMLHWSRWFHFVFDMCQSLKGVYKIWIWWLMAHYIKSLITTSHLVWLTWLTYILVHTYVAHVFQCIYIYIYIFASVYVFLFMCMYIYCILYICMYIYCIYCSP